MYAANVNGYRKVSFWKEKTLLEMTQGEWESLCDGCARCCLHKLQDLETDLVYYTSVACQYLDQDTCRCQNYKQRNELVPSCIILKPSHMEEYSWLPDTCAYRLIHEGKELFWWHHLVSGRDDTVHEANISVNGKCISETHVHPDDFEENIIKWVEQ
ncbi:MAG: YcgN family cysteine cluster protein [Pseudomonadales bacterium]|jgi:uncharacterized cysteine cluster protein YcgN (CxxCxxCC family)|nr:YcgN family cysteine cluster protein [Pseudomonadales bacterium]